MKRNTLLQRAGIWLLLLTLCLTLSSCLSFSKPIVSFGPPSETYPAQTEPTEIEPSETEPGETEPVDPDFVLTELPTYTGSAYEVLNNNIPVFAPDELRTEGYEFYSELDALGRCGVVIASVGLDTMPAEDEDRGSISSVKPTGWVQASYDCIGGGDLYNRAHLIGWQLTAENANARNLVTGTRYLNVQGMLPFENLVADYVKETGNHVAYRVTPIFEGDNLVCSGVQMEAWSVEDNGEGVCFNVYCFNVQPGIIIDYATGKSTDGGEIIEDPNAETNADGEVIHEYVLNTNTLRFHLPSCSSVSQMSEKNKQEYVGSREDLIEQGYKACGSCNP